MKNKRPETGPMRFEDDWCGVFIRGDQAHGFAFAIEQLLSTQQESKDFSVLLARTQLENLKKLLQSSSQKSEPMNKWQSMKKFIECEKHE